jgi:hypothetical protein
MLRRAQIVQERAMQCATSGCSAGSDHIAKTRHKDTSLVPASLAVPGLQSWYHDHSSDDLLLVAAPPKTLRGGGRRLAREKERRGRNINRRR